MTTFRITVETKKTEGAIQSIDSVALALEEAIDAIGEIWVQDDRHVSESSYEISVIKVET